jgi:hypothetical protein
MISLISGGVSMSPDSLNDWSRCSVWQGVMLGGVSLLYSSFSVLRKVPEQNWRIGWLWGILKSRAAYDCDLNASQISASGSPSSASSAITGTHVNASAIFLITWLSSIWRGRFWVFMSFSMHLLRSCQHWWYSFGIVVLGQIAWVPALYFLGLRLPWRPLLLRWLYWKCGIFRQPLCQSIVQAIFLCLRVSF